MKYLLDTCSISDFVKGDPSTLKRIKNCLPKDLAVSVISLMEVQYGLECNPERATKIKPILQSFFERVPMLTFTQESGYQAALMRAYLRKQGTPIGSYDMLIAGTALHHDLTVVTSNTKEFKRVPGLQCEDWRL